MGEVLPGLQIAPNIHPLFVHAPIVLWPVALLFWALALWRRRDDLFGVGRWMLYLGTVGALFAAGTGLLAADQLGHDSPGHELVHVHRDYMLITTALAVVVTVVAYLVRQRNDRKVRWPLVGALLVVNGVAILGADRGAQLVYGHGVGTRGVDAPTRVGHGQNDDHHDAKSTSGAPSSRSAGTRAAGQHQGQPRHDGHDHGH